MWLRYEVHRTSIDAAAPKFNNFEVMSTDSLSLLSKMRFINFYAGIFSLFLTPLLPCPAFGSLPKLDLSKPQAIRVARIINPRLESPTDKEFYEMLEQTKFIFKKYKGVELDFVDAGSMTITQAIERYGLGSPYYKSSFLVPQEQMVQALLNDIEQTYGHMRELIAPLTSHENLKKLADRKSMAEFAVELHTKKLKAMHEIMLEDGKPLLENNGYEDFVAWNKANCIQFDFDLIVTNQLIASMETAGAHVSASLRGGISTGFVSPSKGPYRGAAIFSTFPILSESTFFKEERGKTYGRSVGILIAGAYLTHELAHLILHEGHPVGHKGCLVGTASGLRYFDWYDQLTSNKPCKRRHPKLRHF